MAKVQRAFWFFMAALFLITSLGFSGLVIYQLHQDSVTKKKNADLQKAIDKASNNQTGAKLKGTKLTNFTPLASAASNIQKTDQVVGTGTEAKEGDTITANYTGALASSGTVFESSLDSGKPFTAKLSSGSLIAGWVQGIPGMKAGGKRRLVIPAALAYGSQAQGSIPANSDLVFDIELLKVGQ